MTQQARLQDKSPEQIREELRGFPESAILAVLRFRETPSPAALDAAMRAVLAFFLPGARSASPSLDDLPHHARLREDIGADSLTLAEAAFKLDELLGVPIETREMAAVSTLGDLHAYLLGKLFLGS